MAKEKRAFLDESIQVTPLKEDLAVTQQEAMDVMPLAAVEEKKKSIFFNPKIYEDLSVLSKTIHDTRRTRDAYDFLINEDDRLMEEKALQDKWEQTRKRELDGYYADSTVAYTVDMEHAFEEAVRTNSDVFSAITAKDAEYQKKADQLWQHSPYLGENFGKYRERAFEGYTKRAIEQDYVRYEAKAKYNFDTIANMTANNVRMYTTTTNASGAPVIASGTSLEQAMAEYPLKVFPLLDTLSDSSWGTSTNEGYNTIIAGEIDRISEAVESGQMDIITARNSLLALRAEYSTRDLTGPLNKPNEEEKLATIRCYMTEATQGKLLKTIASLDSKVGKKEAIHIYDSYYAATDGDALTKGKYEQSSYLATPPANGLLFDKVEQDGENRIATLQELARQGYPNAKDELRKLATYQYGTLLPLATAQTIRSWHVEQGTSDQAYKAISAAYKEIDGLIDTDLIDLEKGFHSLTLTDKARTIILDYNLKLSDQEIIEMYGPGTDPNHVRKEYYKQIRNTFKSYLDNWDSTANMVKLHPVSRASVNALEQSNAPVLMVKHDPDTGRYEPNMLHIGTNVLPAYKEAQTYSKAVTGNEDNNSTAILFIKDSTDKIKNVQNARTRDAYAIGIANTFIAAGDTDFLLNAERYLDTDEQKNFAEEVQSFAYLGNTNKNFVNRVLLAMENPSYVDVTRTNLLNDMKRVNATDMVIGLMDKYKVPHKYRGGLQQAIGRYILADFALSGKDIKDYKPNVKDLETIVSSNFTDRGLYRFARNLNKGGLTPESVSKIADKAEEQIHNSYSRMGIGEVNQTVAVNDETGNVDFYIGSTRVDAEGNTRPLFGTGVYPISFKILKPEGMDTEQFEKANNALLNSLGTAVAIVTMTSPTTASGVDSVKYEKQVQKLMEKSGLSKDELYRHGVQSIKRFQDPAYQQAWLDYVKSNGESTYTGDPAAGVNNASKAYRNWMVDVYGTTSYEDKEFSLKLADFDYAYGVGESKLRLDRPRATEAESQGIPQRSIVLSIQEAGGSGLFRVTSTTGGKHSTGIHGEGKAMDVAFGPTPGSYMSMYYSNGPKMGKVKKERLDIFLNAIKTWIENGSIDKIVVGPMCADIVKGIGTDPDYQVYRNLKNKKGEPLFRLIQPELEKKNTHNNHFHIQFTDRIFDKDGKEYNPAQQLVSTSEEIKKEMMAQDDKDLAVSKVVTEAWNSKRTHDKKDLQNLNWLLPDAQTFVNDTSAAIMTNLNVTGRRMPISENETRAIVTLFPNVEATDWDAKRAGRTKEELNQSFFTRTLTQAHRFLIFKEYLGPQNAMRAMYGTKFYFNVLPAHSNRYSKEEQKHIKRYDKPYSDENNYTAEEIISIMDKYPNLRNAQIFVYGRKAYEQDELSIRAGY